MPAYRYYLDAPLITGAICPLPKDEQHHLIKVMRREPGATLEVVNGANQLAQAKLLPNAQVEMISVSEQSPPRPLIFCQALPRLNRLETIVEKGTELGMTQLWLFPGEQSEKKEVSSHGIQRLKTIAIAALKQCGRLDLPHIQLKPPLLKWERLPYPAYFGSMDKEAPWFRSLDLPKEGMLFFVGPESGFSQAEERYLQLHAQGVKLHSNILRTDTAALVALASSVIGC